MESRRGSVVIRIGGLYQLVDNFPNRELIERAEDLILRLRDVKSCRISTDEFGNIAEIHVVAESDRSPKLIARDVETCLNAELGLSIDYRKIGVVLLESEHPDTGADADVGAARGTASARELLGVGADEEHRDFGEVEPADKSRKLEFLEEDARARFKGIMISLEEERVDVEVKLEKNGIEATGSSGAFRHSGDIKEVVASATLHALSELIDEPFHLCLSGLKHVVIGEHEAVVATVDVVEGRRSKSFVGCVFIGKDPNEAAALAVLDAVNRPSGRWKSRKELHYTIR